MKKFILLASLILSGETLVAQEAKPLFMSFENNRQWLESLKATAGKAAQWQMIDERFFNKTADMAVQGGDREYCPLLIIDGIPYETDKTMTDEVRKEIRKLINAEKVGSIAIVDKEPEGSYPNRAFSGFILITLKDKKTRKQLKKKKLI